MGMYNSITQEYGPEPCTNCNRVKVPEVHKIGCGGQWWSLANYHGVSGYFCPDCFSHVCHNSFGKPIHPREFNTIAVKLRLIQANNKVS